MEKLNIHEASGIASRKKSLLVLIVKAGSRLLRNPKALLNMSSTFKTFLRLLKAWALRDYRDVSWNSILMLTAAVVYFINPLDAIPDMAPVIGFLDDIGVIAFVLNSIGADIKRFEEWEKSQKYRG
jgi:uncharacterized membrane protein YkvA (DUF1232 family)